jgi:hypothetical protein
MPDKKREEFFTELFLKYYNSRSGKQYIIDCSPEDRDDITGTYDFLCKEKNSKSEYLAIEEKSLNKSTENVRDNEEIRKIVTEVNRILDKKGLFYNKKYLFHLRFRNAPKAIERDKYAQKIADLVEQKTNEDIDADIHNQVALNIQGYDSIKRFNLVNTQKTQKVVFVSSPESNLSKDVQADAFEALSKIIDNSNSKLKMPKGEGKRTILLITNDWNNFILADEHNIRDALKLLGEQTHEYIDEIFFVNKRSFEDGFDIHKVK